MAFLTIVKFELKGKLHYQGVLQFKIQPITKIKFPKNEKM